MKPLKATIDVELSGIRVHPDLRARLMWAAEREVRRQRRRQQARLFGGMAGIAASLLLAVGLAMLTRGFRLLPGGDGNGATPPPVYLSQPDETPSNQSNLTSRDALPEPTPSPTESSIENVSIETFSGGLPSNQNVEYLGENVEMQFLSYNGRALVARFLLDMRPIESVGIQLEPLNAASGTPTLEYTRYRIDECSDGRLDLTVMALLDEAYMPENVLAVLSLNDEELLALVTTGFTWDIQSASMVLSDKARLREYDILEDIGWESTRDLTADLALNGGTFWLAPPVVIADISLELVRYDVGGLYYHVSAQCAAEAAGISDSAALAGAQQPLTQLQSAGQLPCPACMPDGEAAWDLVACAVDNRDDAPESIRLQDLEMTVSSDGSCARIAGWRTLDPDDVIDALSASVILYGELGSAEYFTNATRLDLDVLPEDPASAVEETIDGEP